MCAYVYLGMVVYSVVLSALITNTYCTCCVSHVRPDCKFNFPNVASCKA